MMTVTVEVKDVFLNHLALAYPAPFVSQSKSIPLLTSSHWHRRTSHVRLGRPQVPPETHLFHDHQSIRYS